MITCDNGDEVKRGAVVLVLFPQKNPETNEIDEYKKRPALVVQCDELNEEKSETIVASITSNTTRSSHARILIRAKTICGKNMRIFHKTRMSNRDDAMVAT